MGLREWKGILNQFHPGVHVLRDDNFDHVEAEKNVGIIEHSQPSQCAARDSPSLFPRFYFDKNQRVTVAAYNIDFATGASAKITVQNFVTATLEESAR
jgi:hypothetical protein